MRRIRSCGNGDSGAVLVLVVLCVSIVLLGVSALVINTGFWYGERAQLQNGADSAAIAVAKSCAQGTCNQAIATTEANNNANDGLTTADMICGTTPGVTSPLAPCTPYQQNGNYCPSAPAAGSSFVNVHTVTPATQAIPVFGKLTGTSKQINACAQAAYGFPGSGDVAPFTL